MVTSYPSMGIVKSLRVFCGHIMTNTLTLWGSAKADDYAEALMRGWAQANMEPTHFKTKTMLKNQKYKQQAKSIKQVCNT